jgi:hypothetical protein
MSRARTLCNELNKCIAPHDKRAVKSGVCNRKCCQLWIKTELLGEGLARILRETDEIRERADQVLITLYHGDLFLEHGRAPQVIGIEECQIVAGRCVDASITRCRGSLVGRFDITNLESLY